MSMNYQQLHQLERLADATKLATLTRLAKGRKQLGWRYQQKTVEEWLEEAATLISNQNSGLKFSEISAIFEEIGIGAIPVLSEALSDRAWRLQISAIKMLGIFGPDAITAV